MGIKEYFVDMYDEAFLKPDPRTQTWPLISSVWPTYAIVLTYLLVILLGQRIMRNREAFQLKSALIAYNFFLVLLNAYILYEFLMTSWLNPEFSKVCEPLRFGTPLTDRLAVACWLFLMSKHIELIDTVFFMLRKKNSQITFLHLYHHTSMVLQWYLIIKYGAGGEAYFSSSINCGIHVLMYSYYMLSAMGPSMQKYLWWKRYMTVLQLMQFGVILFHTSFALNVDCGFPKLYCWCLILYMLSLVVLFSNFYYQTYSQKAKAARTKRLEQNIVQTNGVISHGAANKYQRCGAGVRTRTMKD